MSWWKSTPAAGPKPSSDGGFEAPSRNDRANCWAARDAFFACLEDHGIIDSLKDSGATEKACGREEEILQRDCASSWVTMVHIPSIVHLLISNGQGDLL